MLLRKTQVALDSSPVPTMVKNRTTMTTYDSRPDTYKHIARVRELMLGITINLLMRAHEHDMSKLVDPEVEGFDRMTPRLAQMTYGTDEYKASLDELKPTLDHHYAHNSHHPEHYPDGVSGMDLMDLVEMLCDWKAATERTANGDLAKSIAMNQQRFGYSDELAGIMTNTASRLGML